MKSGCNTRERKNPDQVKRVDALDAVARLYATSLDKYGLASKGVGWKDDQSHLLRFEKLSRVIDTQTASGGITINDLGCGYGAMFRYLDALPFLRLAHYYGYDISLEMLTAAKTYVADRRADFIKSPHITWKADYSFVCGTFNVKLDATDESWTDYIKDSLTNLSAMSTKGFAFNALSTYVDWKEKHLYYADPLLFFDFCKRNISRYVSLLHDYPLFEWTMIVRKESPVP